MELRLRERDERRAPLHDGGAAGVGGGEGEHGEQGSWADGRGARVQGQAAARPLNQLPAAAAFKWGGLRMFA